jgi:sigma-B regulation protein RsbU (phosphoserine phosphatase)
MYRIFCLLGPWLAVFFFLLSAFLVVLLWVQRRHVKVLKLASQELQLERNRAFIFFRSLREAASQGVLSKELYRLIVEGCVGILAATGGALYFVDQEKQILTPCYLTEKTPSFVTLPNVVKEQIALTRYQQEENASSIRSFLKLHTIPRGEGLLGKAWDWSGPKFLTREELPSALVEQGLDAALISPLRYENKIVYVLALGNVSTASFSKGGLELFRIIIEQVAFALYHQAVYHQSVEKKMMDRDIDIAREIQQILLPTEPPILPGYEVSSINIPACSLSGDYFDCLSIDQQHLGIAIADVSGKGLPASLIMTMARTVLRAQAPGQSSPCEVLKLVNRQLYPDMKEDMFISMAYVVIDHINNTAQLARAGHDAPLFYHAKDGTVEKLNPKGMALGIDNGEVFDKFCTDFPFSFESGDCLLLYTDGVTEALNADGSEFGIERLISFLKKNATQSASNLLKRLTEALQHFVAHQPQHDDITIIAIRKL